MLPPVVGKVRPDTPAGSVRAENDRITAIDGQPVGYFDDIGPMIQDLGGQDGAVMVEVEREGQRLALTITTRLATLAGRGDFWMLGIAPVRRRELPPKAAAEHYGTLAAVPADRQRVWSGQRGTVRGDLGGRRHR